MMHYINNFIIRYGLWLSLLSILILLFKPGLPEIRTFILITGFELIAIMLSGLAVYLFTEIKFTDEIKYEKKEYIHTLGFIFLGVHIAVGLTVLGVYIAQFTN